MTAWGIEQRLLELLPSDSCHDFHPFLCWQAKAARPRFFRTFSDFVPHFLKKPACSPTSIRRWCKPLGATRCRQYIKPKITLHHRHTRLSWALDRYDKRRRKFVEHSNVVHEDEKWFFISTRTAVFVEFFRSWSATAQDARNESWPCRQI